MTEVEQLAAFVRRASWESISERAREALKVRVLDSLGCAFGALGGEPTLAVRRVVDELGGNELSTLIGGGRTAPDRAAFYNGALVRYLDYNDVYLAPGESFHPSDNFAPVLAAAEFAGADGKRLLTALAVAYQVQIRLSEEAPVRARGFDHVTQGTFAAAAGVAKALDLDSERTANGIAISGTAHNSLRVTRTGQLSNWKGLAYPEVDRNAVHSVFLARAGVTGPLEVFEGVKGWKDIIAGPFQIDWSREDLEKVMGTDLKKYNSEAHAQSAIEALLDLMQREHLSGPEIDAIQVETFDVGFLIIGGGAEGDKKQGVQTKEQADHSLPYILAVAALDGQVLPPQYAPERIVREDVQSLLRRVTVVQSEEFSRRFPAEMCTRLIVITNDGRQFVAERSDYEGYHTRPMPWPAVVSKFDYLATPWVDAQTRAQIVDVVANLDQAKVTDLTQLIARARK